MGYYLMQNNLYAFTTLRSKKREIILMNSLQTKSLTVLQESILKSSIVMMTYNMVEGVFYTLISSLFDFIIDNEITFETLPKEFQEVYFSYYLKKIGSDSKKLSAFRNSKDLCKIDCNDFLKKEKLFSGNLDAQKIREISKKFGIHIKHTPLGKDLKFIKDTRNKLAHGELSYSVACRDFTFSEIVDKFKSCYKFMLLCTICFEQYVSKYILDSN